MRLKVKAEYGAEITDNYKDIKTALNLMFAHHDSIPLPDGALHMIRENVMVASIAFPDKTKGSSDNVWITLDNGDLLIAPKKEITELMNHVFKNKKPWFWGNIEFSVVPKVE